MVRQKQQDNKTGGAGRRPDEAAPDADADTEAADALNDARALQQMIEGTPDSSDEFKRIEQKQKR